MRSRTVAAAIAFAVLGADHASAAFPGRDGRIAVVAQVVCEEHAADFDPCGSLAFTALLAVAPSGHDARAIGRWPCPACLQGGVFFGPVAYSPDGRRLALQSSTAGQWPSGPASSVLEIRSSDGSNAVRIVVPGAFSHPTSWLPDGHRVEIVVLDDFGRPDRAFVVGADDGSVRALRGGPKGPRTWSSTGSVAIAHARGIYVSSAATGRRLVLQTTARVTYSDPDWSPDGRRLVALRSNAVTRLQSIVTARADGRDRRIVVRGPVPGCQFGPPVWSPSGSRIAFTASCLDRGTAASNALFTVRSSGRGLRTVFEADPLIPKNGSFAAGVGPAVSWQPLP